MREGTVEGNEREQIEKIRKRSFFCEKGFWVDMFSMTTVSEICLESMKYGRHGQMKTIIECTNENVNNKIHYTKI